MKVFIELEGLKEMVKGLDNLSDAAHNRIIRNASRVGATRVKKALQAAAPVGLVKSQASQKHGSLKSNIRVSQSRVDRRFYVVSTGDAFWGGFLESGTGRYNVNPGPKAKGEGARTHIRPTYWFSRAVEQVRPVAEQAMVDNVRKSILREVAKLK